MLLSLAIATTSYFFTGVFPNSPKLWFLQIGLPTFTPLLVVTAAAYGFFRAHHDLQDHAEQLERELATHRTAEQRLAVLATVDDLTQVLNRREFFARAQSRESHSRDPLVVGILDLDHFKKLNDTSGHSVGDEALRDCGAMLRRELGGYPGAVVGRLGGEEFGFLLPDSTVTADGRAITVFEAIREGTRGLGYGITASIGVAEWRPDEETVDAALARADGALYRAKQRGRDTVEVARPGDEGGLAAERSPITRR